MAAGSDDSAAREPRRFSPRRFSLRRPPLPTPQQAVALLMGLAVVAAGAWWFFIREPPAEPAAGFTLTDLDGVEFNLSDYRGEKVVVLDFWALWCTFCTLLAEETLQPLVEAYADELVVLAINADPTDTLADQRDYRADHNFTFRYAPDTDEVAVKYGVVNLPRVVVIDRDGYATFAGLGVAALPHSRVTAAVEEALAGEAETIVVTAVSLYPLAVLAGVFFFFSPCAFPLLPGYVSYYLTGQTRGGGVVGVRRPGGGSRGAREVAGEGAGAGADTTEGNAVAATGDAGAGTGLAEGDAAPGSTGEGAAAPHSPPIGGFNRATLRRALPAGVAAAAGLTLTNLAIAGIILAAASLVKPYLALLAPLMGLVILVLGIAMLAKVQFVWLVRGFQGLANALTAPYHWYRARRGGGVAGAAGAVGGPGGGLRGFFLYGVGYGGAAAGCCAPIFIMLLLLATTQSLAAGLTVMLLYTLTGAALMVSVTLAAAASQRTLLERLRASTRHIEVFSGLLLVSVGAYLVWVYYRVYGLDLIP